MVLGLLLVSGVVCTGGLACEREVSPGFFCISSGEDIVGLMR